MLKYELNIKLLPGGFKFDFHIVYLDGPIKVNSMEGYKPELGDEYMVFYIYSN